MKMHLQNLPIKYKLALVMTVLNIVVLSLASMAFIANEIRALYVSKQLETTALARVLGKNSIAALTFGDKTVALDTLQSLSTEKGIISACLLDAQGRTFCEYTAPARQEPSLFPFFIPKKITTTSDILFEGNPIGSISLTTIPVDFRNRIQSYALITVTVFVLCILLSYFLSIRLQRVISSPILYLLQIMKKVSEEKNYALRARKKTNDELGSLMEGFNTMLHQIQDRDKKLEKNKKNLEKIVEERTGELSEANQRLEILLQDSKEARKKAEAANNAKTQFLANISHELRTPMNGIMGMTEILSKANLTSRQQRLTQTVLSSSKSLLAIINDILELSRMEAGKFTLNTQRFDLWELTEEVINLLYLSATEKKLDLDFSIHPNTPQWVKGDAERLRQILVNIIGNAIKFTEKGKVILRIAPTSLDTPDVLKFEIQDTGIGIPQEAISKIFTPFGQADETMTRKFGGTGLGLSICKELVGMMGGKLGVKSTLGEGSLFWFYIKLAPSMPKRSLDNLFSKESVASRRVLLVSPNIMNKRYIAQVMERHDASCTTINPDETDDIAKKLKNGQFNIVIFENTSQYPLADSFLNALAKIPDSKMWIAQIQSEQEIQRPELNIRSILSLPLRQSECFNILVKSLELENGLSNFIEEQPQEIQEQFPLSLLLVDDNDINQLVATEAFTYWGCKVSIATNGQEALRSLEQENYDIIFMDCQMPIMDGYEATQKIREKEKQSPRNHSIPIIAMTAHAMPTDRQRCLAAGMDDYLIKPFGLEDIRNCLRRWTKKIDTEHGAEKTKALSA